MDHGPGADHLFHPADQSLLREHLCWLRRAIAELTADRDLPGVDIQPQFDDGTLDDHSRLDGSTNFSSMNDVSFHQPTGWPLLDRLSASCYLEPTTGTVTPRAIDPTTK